MMCNVRGGGGGVKLAAARRSACQCVADVLGQRAL